MKAAAYVNHSEQLNTFIKYFTFERKNIPGREVHASLCVFVDLLPMLFDKTVYKIIISGMYLMNEHQTTYKAFYCIYI